MQYLKLIVLTTLLLTPAALRAQQRIAVFNPDRAVAESEQGRLRLEQVQGYFLELQTKLADAQEALDELQQRRVTQERALSASALAELDRQIQDAATQLERDSQDADRDLLAQQDVLLTPIYDQVQQIFQEYVNEQQYALILNIANPESPVIFFSDTIDLTTEIIRRLDSMSGTAETAEPLLPPAPTAETAEPLPPAPQP